MLYFLGALLLLACSSRFVWAEMSHDHKVSIASHDLKVSFALSVAPSGRGVLHGPDSSEDLLYL